jgi:hypothetical protein
MNEDQYDDYPSVDHNTQPNLGSPQQYSQNMHMQDDMNEQENTFYIQDIATLPKSMKKQTLVIGKNKEVEYLPENSDFDFDSVKDSDSFKVKMYPEAIYMGQFQNGIRNGPGVMKYNSGRVYEGEWVDDIRCGKGYERYTNNNVYVGDFK